MIEGGGHCGGHLAQGLGPGRVVDQVVSRDHVVSTEKTEADQRATFAQIEGLLGGRGVAGLQGLAEAPHDGGDGPFRKRQGLATRTAEQQRERAVLCGQLCANELAGLAGVLVEGDRRGLQGP